MVSYRVIVVTLAALAALASCAPQTTPQPEPRILVDTVVMETAPPRPSGTPTTLCLANGRDVEVLVNERGDTLIGPDRVAMSALRPALDFAGNYAFNMRWFERGDPVHFDQRSYVLTGSPVSPSCVRMKMVGDFQGVTLFADVDAIAPFTEILVPVRAGSFQRYRVAYR